MRVLVLLAITACSSSSRPEQAAEPAPAGTGDAASSDRAQVDVRVDRRVELVSIVNRLAGTKEYRLAPASEYVAAVDKTFAPFAKHPAIEATAKLRASGIAYDAPMHLAIRLDDRLQLRDPAELAAAEPRWKGVDVAGYTAQLRDFVAASGFDAFVAAQADHHARAAARLREMIVAEDPVAWFDGIFGPQPKTRYVVVPGLLTGTRNYGTHATLPDGTVEMYQVLGVGSTDGLPQLDEMTLSLLIHEMAHSYINPIFDRHRARFEKAASAIFALVEKPMARQAYATWPVMVNESGVRALTVLYVRDRKGAVAASAQLRDELGHSFLWVEPLTDAFARYRGERARHASFDAYVPQVAAVFDRIAADYAARGLPVLPFLGPVDAVHAAPLAWIAPATGDTAVAEYVRQMHGRLGRGNPLATAAPADRGLIAYGSPSTNAVIAEVAEDARWSFTPTGLALGSRAFQGDGLVLIACWPRPGDPRRGVVVYAAANERHVVGINGVRHGGRDWLVVRRTTSGFDVVAEGNFARGAGHAWLPP